ncbi:protease inhibitor I42 family protein [Candidatus Saganbacteria bacterium]|nr:protease inhibitor I42 family protein [Candidatus Saganbacteria bacterium]
MLKFIGSKYYPQRTGLVGSGGVERWVFRSLKRGRTEVSFKYVRPWEKGIPPVDTRSYQITIR